MSASGVTYQMLRFTCHGRGVQVETTRVYAYGPLRCIEPDYRYLEDRIPTQYPDYACQECQGCGQIRDWDIGTGGQFRGVVVIEDPCPRCDGHGTEWGDIDAKRLAKWWEVRLFLNDPVRVNGSGETEE